jgi:hypothetical protein
MTVFCDRVGRQAKLEAAGSGRIVTGPRLVEGRSLLARSASKAAFF